ncbi:MAG: hypothetical protein H6834_17620 [Planctomycetes bacterium]|nr:hypothetical protein [Planctomycetota bacterium]
MLERPASELAPPTDATSVREQVLDDLRALFDAWYARCGWTCSVHGTQHLGKLAFWLLDACRRATCDVRAFAVARQLVDALREHPRDVGAYVFGPGPADRRNPSQHPIDSGTVTAALAVFARRYGSDLDRGARASLRDACARCIDTYLLQAARTKPVLPQRTWALWGVAEAARAFERDDWATVVRRAVRDVVRERRPDGSFPYVCADASGPWAPGTRGASSFYQSRVLGFCGLAEDALGESIVPCADWERSVRWLSALLTADGVKVREPDVKEFYFDGTYEVVSTPFDVVHHVLAARRLGVAWPLVDAQRMVRTYATHLDANTGINAARDARGAFQCPWFFAAHGLLLSSVTFEERNDVRDRTSPTVEHLEPTGLLHHRDARGRSTWLRTHVEDPGTYQGRARVGRLVRHAPGDAPPLATELLNLSVGRTWRLPSLASMRFAWHVARERRRSAPLGQRWQTHVATFLQDVGTMMRVRSVTSGAHEPEVAFDRHSARVHVRHPWAGIEAMSLLVAFGAHGLQVVERYRLALGPLARTVHWDPPSGAIASRVTVTEPGRVEHAFTPSRERGWRRRVRAGSLVLLSYELPWEVSS